MDLDLGCVASFVILAEELHFGRAAERLHLTSSALSKRIHRLEVQVGVLLAVRRAGGGVSLTPAGHSFAQHATSLLAHAEAAKAAAVGAEWTVRLGLPGTLGEYPAMADLRAVARELRLTEPELRLRCYGLPFSQLTDALLDGRIDLLWTAAEAQDADVVSSPLGGFLRSGVVHSRSELGQATSISVRQFMELPMVYDPSLPEKWMSPWYLGDIRPTREAQLVEVSAENTAHVLRSIAMGTGVAVFPSPIARRLAPAFRAVSLLGAPPAMFYGCTRRGDHRSSVVALARAVRTIIGRMARNEADHA